MNLPQLQTGGSSPFVRATIIRESNGKIDAPTNILQTVSAAYQQYTSLRIDHIPRIKVYAAVEGQVSGNPPYDQEELESNGLGHLTNYNNFKARSAYKKASQMYWNLINAVEVFIQIILNSSIPEGKRYADIMARHFSDIIKEWPDFKNNFNLLGAQLVKIGICPVILPDESSFCWETIEASKFYIPSQTSTNISLLTNCAVDTPYTLQRLYQIYLDADGEDSPWNKESLGNYLLFKANNIAQPTQPYTTPMDLQIFIQSNSDATISFFTENVRLVNMYQQEYSGKYSHYIFSPELFSAVLGGNTQVGSDFLYFVNEQYDSLDEAIIVFTASPGEWTVHSNLGLGQEIFPGAQTSNMLDCSVVDTALMAGTPLIRTLASGGRDASPLRFYNGVVTDIGGAEFVENTIGANITQMVNASAYVSQTIDLNALNSGQDPSVPDRSTGSISAPQAMSQDFKEFNVLKNIAAHFYDQFDKLVRIMFIRMLKMKQVDKGYEYCKEWKLRCKEDGVPDILFDTVKKGLHGLPRQFRSVKASRVAGDGSTLARIMGLQAMTQMGLTQTFNQKEMAAFKREAITAIAGVDNVGTYASSDDQPDETQGGYSIAVQENNGFKRGDQAGFSLDNEHGVHAMAHVQLLTEITKATQSQQMSPVDADRIFRVALPHTQEHIQAMAQAPMFYQQVLSQVDKPFKQIMQYAQLNRRNAEAMNTAAQKKQAEDEAKTQAVMTDAQRKDFVAEKDAERSDKKLDAQIERAKEASQDKTRIAEDKAYNDAETKRLKAKLDAEVKGATAKGRSQLELENTSPAELDAELDIMTGETPSSVDFE